ncbi:MAG: hypothetical protein NTV25_03725 [Methanothrix sp.]|nr:hypothetical protein [Methanothrix sp.]
MIRVVFPEPFSPTRATTWPGFISMFTSSKTQVLEAGQEQAVLIQSGEAGEKRAQEHLALLEGSEVHDEAA